MEISAISSSVQTAVVAESLNAQTASVKMILKSLQSLQEMQMQMLESLGVGQNISITA
jgi:hypothetical protein